MELLLILGAISGESLINALIWLVVAGLILWVLYWGLGEINPPEPWKKVAKVILVLITVVVLINILLSLVGKPLIRF